MDQALLQDLPADAKEYIAELEHDVDRLDNQVKILLEELRLARYRSFGRSSEQYVLQQNLFGDESLLPDAPAEDDNESNKTKVNAYQRKKPGPQPLDPNLPRVVIIHDLTKEEKQCACGNELSKIEKVVTERLKIIPEQVVVEQHIYYKYACRLCEGSGDEDKPVFRKAATAPSLIPGSIITPELLAFIHVNKFCDHLPFYRQEQRFERLGARISRQDMSNWTVRAYGRLKNLEKLFVEHLRSGPIIQMDETTVQVLGEPDRPDTSKSYMWVAKGGPPDNPLIYYHYNPSRAGKVAETILEDYNGYVQTDGYPAYDSILKNNKAIIHVGCMAHLRRKFMDAAKAVKKSGTAHEAVKRIQRFYAIEHELRERDLSPSEFQKERQTLVTPIADDLKAWLDKKVLQVRPDCTLGKAISYARGQWDKVIRYLESPYLTPDTNSIERCIKPLVLGRKNWLFGGSPSGMEASSFVFSLIETAKANNLNPWGYLRWLYTEAAMLNNESDFSILMPWNCDREKVNEIKFTSP